MARVLQYSKQEISNGRNKMLTISTGCGNMVDEQRKQL